MSLSTIYEMTEQMRKSAVDVGSIDNKNMFKCGNDWQASKMKYLLINTEQFV